MVRASFVLGANSCIPNRVMQNGGPVTLTGPVSNFRNTEKNSQEKKSVEGWFGRDARRNVRRLFMPGGRASLRSSRLPHVSRVVPAPADAESESTHAYQPCDVESDPPQSLILRCTRSCR